MFKKIFILCLMITSLFGGVRELTDENFSKATNRGLVAVEFWAGWNEVNKVTAIDEWDTFDAKVYRVNIDNFPNIQADNNVVVLPTIIFYLDGDEAGRLQGNMKFQLETTKEELDRMVEELRGSKFN